MSLSLSLSHVLSSFFRYAITGSTSSSDDSNAVILVYNKPIVRPVPGTRVSFPSGHPRLYGPRSPDTCYIENGFIKPTLPPGKASMSRNSLVEVCLLVFRHAGEHNEEFRNLKMNPCFVWCLYTRRKFFEICSPMSRRRLSRKVGWFSGNAWPFWRQRESVSSSQCWNGWNFISERHYVAQP